MTLSSFVKSVLSVAVVLGSLGLARPAAAQDTVLDIEFDNLDFSGATLQSGSDREEGAVYIFPNLATITPEGGGDSVQIRARLTLVDISNATLSVFDATGSAASRLQPEISTGSGGGFIDYRIEFLDADDNPVYLNNFAVTGVDVDGASGSVREYQEVGGFTSYTVDDDTGLTVSAGSAGRIRFLGLGSSLSGVSFDDSASYITNFTTLTSEITFRMGVSGQSGSARQFSIAFGAPGGTFSDPTVTSAPSVVLTTDATDASSPFSVTATFSEAVTLFEAIDILSNGGAVNIGSFAAESATVYTFTIEPDADTASVTVFVPAGAGISASLISTTASNVLVLCHPDRILDGSACVLCTDSGLAIDNNCDASAPICAAVGLGEASCVECLGAEDCGDGNDCTQDACDDGGFCQHEAAMRGTGCGEGVCNGDTDEPTCLACIDDETTMSDTGCGGSAQFCVETATEGVCVVCTTNLDCGDSNECTSDVCSSGLCANPVAAEGTVCSGGFCDGESTPMCVLCVDDSEGTDTGCSSGMQHCVGTGGAQACVACTTNSHCGDSNECTSDVCASGACTNPVLAEGTVCTGGFCDGETTPMCVLCVDDSSGTDTGCSGAMQHCVGTGGAQACVACTSSTQCNDSNECTVDVCSVSGSCSNTAAVAGSACADGVCRNDTMCVQCLVNTDCDDGEVCGGGNACVPEADESDNDGDGIPDADDVDDDNDGVLDTQELGGDDLSADSDDDGVPDYRDADFVDCDDVDTDGACDTLGETVDFDGDGIPNHFDLDSDGDGLTDLRETDGPVDANDDGVIDNFTDTNDDGLDDRVSDEERELSNVDGTDGPDFLDLDADGDGVPDTTEATDVNRDGDPDQTPSGDDENNDGLDDAFDGTGAPTEPDSDSDGTPDWRDTDDDGDGVTTDDERIDTNDNGVPDYLEPPATIVAYSGGAGCAVGTTSSSSSTLWLLIALGGFMRSRSKRHSAAR